MKNNTKASDELENCLKKRTIGQFHRALGTLTGKWKGEILWQLVQGKLRFGELRRSIPGVTQHMLTTQLRDLEADGLVKRTIYPEVPPRVEYEITPAAEALRPVFDELFKWSQEHGFPEKGSGKGSSGARRSTSAR
ncbi:MAG: helix-turn-helix domain-containing protein [Xanthobacteraceae bacterium]|nr:helix-turn-helix domain-containing protein [Xanthobacteraceae bacterium]